MKEQAAQQGQRHRELVARRSREKSAGIREIAPLPPIVNPQRRMKARKDFRYFCEQYYPQKFKLSWAEYHLTAIKRMQTVMREGGSFALAMPRGSGKSTLAETAVIWALLNGHCRYVVIIGASKKLAKKTIDNIKSSLINSDVLLDDYPESIYPFRKLEGQGLRARGQLYLGDLTEIEWKPDSITFAKIAGSPAAGATAVSTGINSAIRGLNKTMPDGSIGRPDVVLLDDPQTDTAARSPEQVKKLEETYGSLRGLAGPGNEIDFLILCTVIQDGDFADNVLNHNLHPELQGQRTKLIKEMPERMDLWEQYKEIRRNEDETAAKMFYKRNRTEMQKGAVVEWKDNYNESCLDALQFAMNKWSDNYASFMAEYQNEPLRVSEGTAVTEAKVIRSRLNGLERETLPSDASVLTAFIDVHDDILYYAVAAWEDTFTGYIIDYGTLPEQSRRYFKKGDTGLHTLKSDIVQTDGAVVAGLSELIKNLSSACWYVDGDEDGKEHPVISKILVDIGYADKLGFEAIRLACGKTTVVMPSRGHGISASDNPMSQWKRKPGERFGHHWIESKQQDGKRYYKIDTNYWKSQVHKAFQLSAGSGGGLTLWGRDPEEHRMFSEHLAAEMPVFVEAKGQKVNVWKALPNRDNHFFDCVVGTMAAASICGITAAGEDKKVERKKIKLSEMRR